MKLLYYIDKFTEWLDFSWIITKRKHNVFLPNDNPPEYEEFV